MKTIEHLIGLQAQAPFPPYYGRLSRLDGFLPDDLVKAKARLTATVVLPTPPFPLATAMTGTCSERSVSARSAVPATLKICL